MLIKGNDNHAYVNTEILLKKNLVIIFFVIKHSFDCGSIHGLYDEHLFLLLLFLSVFNFNRRRIFLFQFCATPRELHLDMRPEIALGLDNHMGRGGSNRGSS